MNRYCYNCMFPVLETDTVCPHCGKPPEVESAKHLLAPGTLLHGRYLLGRALGQGGFGITYIGRDELLNMRVAVKEFYPNGYAYRDHAVSNAITITASGQDFFRVHRAYLINLAYVKSYDSKSVRVGDAEIPVARGKYQDLIKAYLSYYTRREGL